MTTDLITTLPGGVMEHFAEFISARDLISLRRVNRRTSVHSGIERAMTEQMVAVDVVFTRLVAETFASKFKDIDLDQLSDDERDALLYELEVTMVHTLTSRNYFYDRNVVVQNNERFNYTLRQFGADPFDQVVAFLQNDALAYLRHHALNRHSISGHSFFTIHMQIAALIRRAIVLKETLALSSVPKELSDAIESARLILAALETKLQDVARSEANSEGTHQPSSNLSELCALGIFLYKITSLLLFCLQVAEQSVVDGINLRNQPPIQFYRRPRPARRGPIAALRRFLGIR